LQKYSTKYSLDIEPSAFELESPLPRRAIQFVHAKTKEKKSFPRLLKFFEGHNQVMMARDKTLAKSII